MPRINYIAECRAFLDFAAVVTGHEQQRPANARGGVGHAHSPN